MKLKRKERSTQELIGIKNFTRYGLNTSRYELVFFSVAPTNISVLSAASIETKIWHLMMVLSTVPDIEITCLDSCECFDGNKQFIRQRLEEEQNPMVRKVLEKDFEFLDNIQVEMSTARQFMFVARIKKDKEEQVLQSINRIEKAISEQSFEIKRMKKNDIKHMLAIYFGAGMSGETISDIDGEKYIEEATEGGI